MHNEKRIARMREKLEQQLKPVALEIIDESHKHVGHAGAASGAGHFKVIITADIFSDKSLLQQHRIVYDALADMMQTDIHALSIQSQAPQK